MKPSDLLPTPPPFKEKSHANDLQARLDWGEPALTIIDVRDHESFNKMHIMGAISIPFERLPEGVLDAVELKRDLYIYGDSDEQTAEAAAQLRSAGFTKVAELIGGLPAWQAGDYPVEAISAVVG